MEMAHALHGYDGLCKNIHGHSYKLWVTLRGNILEESGHKKDGMVLDFSLLMKLVKPSIIDKYDHSLVLNANSPHADIDLSAFEKVFFLPYQPTSENLVSDFVSMIKDQLPENIELYKVVLSETANSFAEWCLDDN
jgi:6-pyruvoyltetrahydropterin/6-carboxytetrahydropterin synthase